MTTQQFFTANDIMKKIELLKTMENLTFEIVGTTKWPELQKSVDNFKEDFAQKVRKEIEILEKQLETI